MSSVSKEFNPDIFAVAVAYSAPKYVSLMLRQNPDLATDKTKAWPPLLVSLLLSFPTDPSRYRNYQVMRMLLEHGADLNEPFQGTTPWRCFLENSLVSYLFDPYQWQDIFNRTIALLVQYGADIHVTWDWLGYTMSERIEKVDRIVPSFTGSGTGYQQEVPDRATVTFQLSAAAVLFHLMTGVGCSERENTPAPEWLPSVPEQEQVVMVLLAHSKYGLRDGRGERRNKLALTT